ncbi:MAG: D-glycerate dehydrogenase [Candidatus Kaiserbacteria bacterium]|nr:D-glycerate dehydrogenase [Candidatus Kaiserbacteria bacterium]MCB9816783.1 D-glycerate dehydrogenase [Candidatus Nomurabacteria bacterium]
MALIFVTRKIPDIGLDWMRDGGHEVVVSEKDGVLTETELKKALAARPYDGVVSLLTDTINMDILSAAPQAKIVANYAVGFNNIDVKGLTEAGITITNTPGVLTDTVAEYAVSLILSLAKRIPEADKFTRAGKYKGWAPELLLGSDLMGKTLGIVGAGRIGSGVAKRLANGFGMKVKYYDIARSEALEADVACEYYESLDELLQVADVVSVHVPLLPATKHLINAERLAMMKSSAYLINTSRGPVVDEKALVKALKAKVIRGAGLDVFEDEPKLAPGLAKLDNVVLTPHIASASEETRGKMSELVAYNINEFFLGHDVPNPVLPK